jgi:hypothetical protein
MSACRVDVLMFDGCPNVELTLARVREAVAAVGGEVAVRVVRVETEERARELAFLGSPSVRVDDVDVQEDAWSATNYGLQCRIYEEAGRLEGAPPAAWITAALRGKSAGTASDQTRSTEAAEDDRAPDCCERKS